jgi:hypothetical protein
MKRGAFVWLLVAIAWPATAGAHGGGRVAEPPTASELEPGPIKRLVLDVQTLVREGKHDANVVSEPLGHAIEAADRARSARSAGDRPHGTMLDKLAEQWAQAAKSIVRAVEADRRSQIEAKRLTDVTTKVERAQALLTEQQARLGRLQAELKKAEQAVATDARHASDKEKQRIGVAGGQK